MLGAKVPDQNGAALRLEGTNFTLRGSFLQDNESGVLSGANTASNVVIEDSELGHKGFGTGLNRNLYIGNVASLTFRYNFSHYTNVGHNLKLRARQHDYVQPLLEPARRRNRQHRRRPAELRPGFVNRAAYDLRPTANAMVIDAGSAPGVSASGVALNPIAVYRHVAAGATRATVGASDIGAYEAN